MKNRPGPPVDGEDFFDRPRDLARLRREIGNGNNLLLTAPRRVGKTSLVLRLAELCRRDNWAVACFNVEGCSDEIAFAEKLVEELRQEKVHPELLARLGIQFQKLRQSLGGMKVGIGVDVELGDGQDPDHSTLGRALESMFRGMEKAGNRDVLIIIDEMPELLLTLKKSEHGADRIAHLLHWLRELRQTYRKRIHWVFLGSIGLDGFVESLKLGKAINDLLAMGLDALTLDEADEFLAILGRDNGLPLTREVRQDIIARVGWPLPHHLQVVFHALVDVGVTNADLAAVERAIVHLDFSQFGTWRQRLDDQFSDTDAGTAKAILNHLCQYAQGRSRAQLMNVLMRAKPSSDPDLTQNQLAKLLAVLLHDGYLLESDRKYTFRSFLLREYWNRHEIR
ncbi:MAG: hypothetical protein JWN70_7040 [Planctomycetaceae bacterium]|nr:hypothetical protein [Planctomycetaceae bacterium]